MNLPLNIDLQQILLHLFNFTVLFGVLYFLLYKPVKDFMDQRTAMYKKMDDDAKDALQDAENAKSRYLEKLAAAEEEIEEKKDAAYKEQEKERAVRLKQAEEEAAKIVADAHQKMEKEHEKMIAEAQNEISEMVITATEKLILESTTSDAYDQFLDSVKGVNSNE